jgi:hypothetical protein
MMLLLAMHAAFGAPHGVEDCLTGSDHSALMFCQELAPPHQLELAARYRIEPTERIAMLLGTQQELAVDLVPLIREEQDVARWYWLAGGEVERTGPTPDRRLRQWARTPGDGLDFVVQVMDDRGLRISQCRWRRLTTHPDPDIRGLAVNRLASVRLEDVADGLENESDSSVRMRWARRAFALDEEPNVLRSAITSVEAWKGMAYESSRPWARRWLVEEMMATAEPSWLIRRFADEPPPELWTRCAGLLDAPPVRSLDALDERAAQSACVHAWRVRTGRDDLSYDEAVVLSGEVSP